MTNGVTVASIKQAAIRLQNVVVRTPLIESHVLNTKIGARVFLKLENFQHFGSFKLRGAYNAMSQLPASQLSKGVVACSSGNHAQGVAYAAALLGATATIIIPKDAPKIKIANVAKLGAELIYYDRYKDDRDQIGRQVSDQTGRTLIPSYDHADVISGQGTIAIEAVEQAAEIGVTFDYFVTACGGGGLASGCATVLEKIAPLAKIYIVEPEGFAEAWTSVQAGIRQRVDISRKTICDAIATPSPGRLTLPILTQSLEGGVAVTEQEVAMAMKFAFDVLKIVVEPGGVVPLAALLAGKLIVNAQPVCLVMSGGNIDFESFISIVK